MANLFSLGLVVATLITGIIWLIDKFIWAPQRKRKIEQAQESASVKLDKKVLSTIAPKPVWIENTAPLFPIIAAVLIIRSFVYEPFQIPSGSMMPTLLVGDFILVEKYAYGIHDPVMNKTMVETGLPQRGDIVVFKYPPNPSIDYIKRTIGLPGDTIRYENKHLCIQPKGSSECQEIALTDKQKTDFMQQLPIGYNGAMVDTPLTEYKEHLGTLNHEILHNPMLMDNPQRYQPRAGITQWVVPENSYFMMGDNRDNSADSRYWGFVPKANLVGKAVAIWISFEFDRTADDRLPTWIPTGVRFNRIGSIK